jgi:arylsulfatase A-like enzyme
MPAGPRPPDHNVLFLLTDQWRHDALGFAGSELAHTPALDRLAAGATVFDRALTSTPLCSPARGCMMTGRWPHQTGMTDNIGVGATRQQPLGRERRTWLEAARDAGFRVGFYGKWHLGEDGPISRGAHGYSRAGFDRGRPPAGAGDAPATETGELRPDYVVPAAKVMPGGKPPFYGVIGGTIDDTPTGKTAAEAIGFLNTPDPAPWFLTVSFHGPHFPHLMPEPFASLIDPDRVPLPASMDDDFGGKPWFQGRTWWPYHDTSDLDEDDWRRTAAAYYGMIAMIDEAIGRVTDAACAAANGRPTTVVFTSDHGEMLGAHNRFDKGPYFYDEVMRVPLVIRPTEGAASARRHEFVSPVDLGATLFGLAGERCEGTGRDLLSLIAGDSPDAWPDEAFGWYESYNGHSFELRSVRTPDHRYCFNPQDVDELYDLREDPNELTNLAGEPDHADIAAALRERVFDWMRREGDPLVDRWRDLPSAGSFVPLG